MTVAATTGVALYVVLRASRARYGSSGNAATQPTRRSRPAGRHEARQLRPAEGRPKNRNRMISNGGTARTASTTKPIGHTMARQLSNRRIANATPPLNPASTTRTASSSVRKKPLTILGPQPSRSATCAPSGQSQQAWHAKPGQHDMLGIVLRRLHPKPLPAKSSPAAVPRKAATAARTSQLRHLWPRCRRTGRPSTPGRCHGDAACAPRWHR